MNKKAVASLELILIIASIFAFSYILYQSTYIASASTMSEPSVCCEKTTSGAVCINTQEGNCEEGYRSSPTSCETTSYCRLGTCYDSQEGICMENTPQIVCEENGGTWDSRKLQEVPQCQLGCCIIADQAAFVPLVRCKRLSTLFGVENNYRTDITNEISCIATAQAQDKGACVFEKDFERICEFTTRDDCGAGNVVETANGTEVELSSQKKFYENYLCSAEELNTACAKQTSTTCYDGKVYFVDSCGNLENVYSSNKEKSWNNGRVAEPEEICSPNDGSNKDCGNCEYLLGSRCETWTGLLGKPSGSDHYCQKTECVDRNGEKRINGESWCVNDGNTGSGSDMVGSRYYREVCVDGEVRVEPCADFRNEICIDGSIETDLGEFKTSACRVNRWHDCVFQTEEDDCTNIDRRDCMWVSPVTGMILSGGSSSGSTSFSNPTNNQFSNPTATGNVVAPITGHGIFGGGEEEEQEETTTNRPEGICVPNYTPGLDFWSDTESSSICGQASAKCIVVFEKGLIGGKKCVENCECLEEGWAMQANRVCSALGDCGAYVNYQGKYTDDGYKWTEDGAKKELTPNNINIVKKGFTGMVISAITGFTLLGSSPFVQEGITAAEIVPVKPTGAIIPVGPDLSSVANAAATPTVSGVKSSWLANKVLGEGVTVVGETTTFSGGAILLSGLQWAGIAYGIGYLAGSLFGMTKDNTQALSMSLAAGAFVYKSSSMLFANMAAKAGGQQAATGLFATKGTTGFMGIGSLGWGLIIGATIFIMMYKKVETVTVTFDCMPWQAPTGGNDCEICNDENLPCSEYRCRSLGQNCELVNPGSTQEKCVNVNPNDVNPPIIKPDYNELTYGHEYTNVKLSPPGPGFQIVNKNSSDGCLKAFTPLKFGVITDEPSQCRIDFNHTTTIEEMSNYMGGSNLYLYNHTEQFSLPGAQAFKNSSFILDNGNEFTFYLRCQDKNGNENEAEYAVRFCVEDGPDATAPEIRATSILNGGCVAEESDSAIVDFYTNEPAECKWSTTDQSYENMQNSMSCQNQMYQVNAMQLFTCRANLTGVSRDTTDFYIRCKDQPGEIDSNRNDNKESFKFSLRGSTGLKILNIQPNNTIFGGVSPAPIELYVQTQFGCDNGQSICYYSTTGNDGDYIMFYDTDNTDGIHTQRQDLTSGDHTYYIKCVDSGGNVAEQKLDFKLDIDTSAPVIARAYEEESMLKIVTLRDSECSYSLDNCDFTFDEGTIMPYPNSTVHVTEWNKDNTYYIKCRDEFRNEPADCSMIVKPSRKLF